MLSRVVRWWRDEEGQGLVEYGLIIALVALAVVTVIGFLGDELAAIFQRIVTTLQGA